MNTIALTKQQERCVDYEGGDLLIKGVAGSGKSYVILSRAKKVHDRFPELKTTIFTFQKTLVTYTKALLRLQLKDDAINVSTIDSYCKNLYLSMKRLPPSTQISALDKNIVISAIDAHRKQSTKDFRLYHKDIEFWIDEFNWIRGKCISSREEYKDAERIGRGSEVRVTREDRDVIWDVYRILLMKMRDSRVIDWNEIYIYINNHADQIPDDKKIDYVFVDEAQDMTLGKMKVLKTLTKRTITIAADVAQKIYKTSFTWKEVGIDVSGGGSKSLSKSFRSTKQIVLLAEDLMKENRISAPDNNEYTEAVLPEAEGILPRLCICKTPYLQNGYIESLLKEIDLSERRVAIIVYSDKEVTTIKKTFYAQGIKYQYIDPQTKDRDILSPGVKIIKAHSSKGLEFDYVIIPYLTDYMYPYKPNKVDKEAMEEYLRQQRSVLYVAMTRARIGLIMLTIRGSESRFIKSFAQSHYKVEVI